MNVKYNLRKMSIHLGSAFLLCIIAVATLAKTPDGIPPANEGVCDELNAEGITPGLYGLCVAYCEAMDCDLEQIEPEEIASQCKAPSHKILERYNSRKTDPDPEMPCVQQQGCPCWTTEEINDIGLTWESNKVLFFPNNLPSYITFSLQEEPLPNYGAYQVATVRNWYETGPECSYAYYDSEVVISRSQQISLQQADACELQMMQQKDDLEYNGVPVFCLGNLCQ